MVRHGFAVALVITTGSTCIVSACASDDAPAGTATGVDGGASSSGSTTSSSGSTTSSSGGSTTSSSGGTATAGKAVMTATFTSPLDGYNGATTDFVGVLDKGKCTLSSTALGCASSNGATDKTRQLSFSTGASAPVVGTPVEIAATGDDYIRGKFISYQELDVAPVATRNYLCGGTLTFDSITGKEYKFHFTATCTKNLNGAGKAVGGVTITATGSGSIL